MLLKTLLLVALVALLAPHTTQAYDVEELNRDYYEEAFENASSLIMFYAPWCNRSKAAMKAFEQLAEEYDKDENVFFGLVDCMAETKLCQTKKVGQFPSFLYTTMDRTSR
jgi:thiol-disulfide isomerase/thioredoxin